MDLEPLQWGIIPTEILVFLFLLQYTKFFLTEIHYFYEQTSGLDIND